MSLRSFVQRLRRSRGQVRIALAATVAGLGSLLGTAYDAIPAVLHLPALLLMGLLGGLAVLLTDPPEKNYEQIPVGAPQAPRKRSDRRSRRQRSRLDPARRWLAGWRRRRVPTLPSPDELFRGRERELRELQGLHDIQRSQRPSGVRSLLRHGPDRRARRRAAGPVVLLVHGMAGVGKSSLADELARRLARSYPHGQIVVNLGTGGAARNPAEILKDFLIALGWAESEMPDTAVGRAMIFRSLTAKKKILFILDAARNADQVWPVLPSDPAAAVIITSRRALVWPDPLVEPSYSLNPPDEDEALAIFRAVSRTGESVRPECAAEVVQLCGRLPLALRAAGERVSKDGADICQIAALLRESRSRLNWLDRPGRSLHGHLRTEYDRLLPREQRALCMLALIPSATFVPWVLGPLLELDPAEAEALVDRLAAAQLLEDLGPDVISPVARYGLHPLVKLFATEQVRQLPAYEVEEAQERLVRTYAAMAGAALAILEPDLSGNAWAEADPHSKLPALIADHPVAWVRAEYPNLLKVIESDLGRDADFSPLCWRIGAWLDGCVAEEISQEATLRAYDRAVDAAEQNGVDLGVVDVLLAKGSYLVAVERYRDAEACFGRAVERARRLAGDPATVGAARRRLAVAARKIGEGFLQAGAYTHAVERLEEAARLAEVAGEKMEQRLVGILLAEAHHVDFRAEAVRDEIVYDQLTESTRYRIRLSMSEASRRRGDWQSAAEYLDQASRCMGGDQRRTATLRYRRARLLLEECAASPAGPRPRAAKPGLAEGAVRRAAGAVVAFRQMANPIGVVRAQCLLARAVLALGHPVEADQIVRTAERDLDALLATDEMPEVLAPLVARLCRVTGEIRLAAGDRSGGRQLLVDAATAFSAQKDWAGLRGVLRLLESVTPAGPVPGANGGPAAITAPWWPAREAMPVLVAAGAGPLALAPAVTDTLAARLGSQVVQRVQDELRQDLAREEPVVFRGALGAGLDGAELAEGHGAAPVWRVPVGETCELTVLVATGWRAYAGEPGGRPDLVGVQVWREVVAAVGTPASHVDLTVLVDAPFVEVAEPELTAGCPVEDGRIWHRTSVRATTPGGHDLRISLVASGRLVQSLPIELMAEDPGEGA